MFKELSKKSAYETEQEIGKYWQKIDVLNATINNREGKENFVFFEGPPTANGMPGIHHVISRDLKDSICKFKTMKGYRVVRKAGWDTHGLPVEIEVEKTLGLNDKKAIEEYGIDKFNVKCKESVWKYKSHWEQMTREMGYFVNLDEPYVTYDNNYIETEWWILKKYYDEGLVYEGHKILPYCPRCGTGLASHEVAQGYKEVNVDTVTVPMKLKGEEDTYFLVWTTTPWTLMSNVAICVNPQEKYIKVESKGHKFILAEKLANKVLGSEYIVLETYNGTDLEYIEYEQLLPFIIPKEKAFYVTCDDYVTMEDGTGIVHIAPAFGQDDANVGKRYNLPFINPVDEQGKYMEGPWTSMLVFEADLEVIKYLKENDKLFKKEKLKHNYPHCWRCQTPLIYYAKPSWYLEVTKLKDKIVEQNKTINWYPDFVGEKRFGNWLENMNDWAISRSRYWGTPFPLWKCECGHKEMIGSREELINKSVNKIDESIDLHRPYVDKIEIICPVCGKHMLRVKDVIDCWFDSGSMPFAQYHYPFENKELFESQFPADFICEGIDQTRGWFYSLLQISTFVLGKAPYKNVLVNDLILDKNGQKMSKSRGNGVSPFDLFKSHGADALRWYLVYGSPVWAPTRFDEEGLKEVYSKFFSTLKNIYNFYVLYANLDNIDPRSYIVDKKDLDEIDLWLLSKYNNLVDYVTKSFEEYDLTKVTRAITDFVSEDLSNWYIRRNRKRFWDSEITTSKRAVYQTTYEVLVGLSKLIAPIVPFLSEELYRNLTDEKSVHLADYPVVDKRYINNKLEIKMDLVRDLISLGRNVREEVKIKVRQPISEVILDGKNEKVIGDLAELIKEELNVKSIRYTDDLSEYMNFEAKPNFKECGKVMGSNIKLFQEELKKLSSIEVNNISNGKSIAMKVGDIEYEVNKEMVDVRISSKEGFNATNSASNFIILNVTLTKDLIEEGIIRELISKVQQLRKTKDFDIADRINIYYGENEELSKIINKFENLVKQETLAEEILIKETSNELVNLNGLEVNLDVEKRKN